MPFSSYASVGEVARAYRISCSKESFIQPLPMPVSEHLRAELDFALRRVGFEGSEAAVCENLVFPILREVWKCNYLDMLELWSHIPLDYDTDLSGTPDYFLARRSALGNVVTEEPYLLIVEAKKDDFVRGWGQCLAAMLAAQKLNERPDVVMRGITTNGRAWEFGQLQGANFTQDLRPYSLLDLDQLCAALNFTFDQCRRQLAAFAPAA